MLNNIKLLLGLTADDKDELIQLLILKVQNDARMITGVKDLLIADSLIEDMVIYRFNRLGTEGLNSESYSGITYNYESNYPEFILEALDATKKSQLGKGGFQILW